MSLKILYSDRIDSLASDLKRRLLQDPSDPFVFRQVVVPNGNLAKWLQMRAFADEPSLCAGIDFPFMDHFLLRLLAEALPEEEQVRSSRTLPSVQGAIASVLLSDPSPELAPLRRYVDPDANTRPCRAQTEQASRKLWQLSAKLTELFKEYELRRPELIAGWLGEDPYPDEKGVTSVEKAEAALYRLVYGPDGVLTRTRCASSLRAVFEKVAGGPPSGPGRTFYFFGHSSLSPLHADILHWLAQTHDVVFYHLTVCIEYWGDIKVPWERIAQADPSLFESEDSEGDDLGIENELLNGWGRAGRSTMKLMIDKEEASTADCRVDLDAIGPVAEPVASDSVLAIAQASVRHRTSTLPRRAQDASIQVVACQGIRREVEMVYNAILGAVLEPAETGATGRRPWEPCDFSDIAVLVPDMATYRPMIEAVFDARGQIPYGLIDATASQTSRFLQGILDLLRLATTGLDRTTLFAVLGNPCVQRALRFDPDQLRIWRKRVDEIGAFRSFDDADSASRGLACASNFTWDYALSRLRLGAVAVPDAAHPLAVGPEGDGEADDLRLSEIVELLYRRLAPLRERRLPFAPLSEDGTPADYGWIDEVASVVDRFLAVDPEDALETGVRRDLFSSIRSLSIVEGDHPLALLIQFIEQSVGAAACRRGGYLTSGVTIAALQPMRPVPFKQVFVLGLGESFPGMVSDSSLDLRGLKPHLGDARMPDINRYLFLETFMATRDRLVLSYLSKDIKKDADLFPSSVVRDLIHFLDDHVLETAGSGAAGKGGFRMVDLPLLETDPRCTGAIEWREGDSSAGILPTYRGNARIAESIQRGMAPVPVPPVPLGPGKVDSSPCSTAELSIGALARFMEKPVRALFSRRFGVAIEGYQDSGIAAHEPLALEGGKATWDLEASLFAGWLKADPIADGCSMDRIFQDRLSDLQKHGRLPEGGIGEYELQRILEQGTVGGKYADLFRRTGLHDLPGAKNPRLHVRYVVPLEKGGERTHAILSDDLDYYFPAGEDGIATIFVMHRFDWAENEPPPSICARPFLAWLALRASGGGSPGLRVTMLDTTGKGKLKDCVWEEVAPEVAADALRRLTQDWFDYPATADPSGQLPDYDYKDLRKAWSSDRDGNPDWAAIREQLAEGVGDYIPSAAFNNDLVIQGVADHVSRPPASDGELAAIYENRFGLFFKGKAEAR